MTSPVKKIFSETIIYTAGSVFNRFLPFLLLPVYTYYFKPEVFGTFSLIYSFWFVIVVFYLYGMETSFQKLFIEAKSDEEKKSIFSSTLLLILITSVLFSILIFFLSGFISLKVTSSSENAYLIRLLSVILVIDALYRFPLILINSLQKSKLYTGINAAGVIINVFLNIVLIIFLGYGIEAIFLSYLVSYLFVFIVSFSFSLKYFGFSISRQKVNQLFRAGLMFLVYGLFLVTIDLADRFIIEYFKGSAEVGIYSACYRIGVVMNLVITGFKVAWTPFFMNMKREENNREIFSRVFTYFCYGGLIAFLMFSLLADDIVKINIAGYSLLNNDYWSGLGIVPYILMAYLFSGLYLNLTIASFFQNKIKYLVTTSGIGAAFNIILNFILIPEYSIIGAAASTTISYLLMFVLLYYYSQKLYKIDYEWGTIARAAALTAMLYIANIYIPAYLNLSYMYKLIIEFFSILLLIFVLLGSKGLKLLRNSKSVIKV